MAAEKATLTSGLTQAQRTGRAGEDYTAGWLQRQGYKLVARNWHCKWGEMDLIATKGDLVVFVEVKSRKQGSLVTPCQAVDWRKRSKLLKTAYSWLGITGCRLQPRMDVAAVTTQTQDGRTLICAFEYIESAFDGRG